MGISIGADFLYTLMYADDQVILANDEEDINYMTRKLIEEYEKWGLDINVSKTKYMVVGGNGQDLLTHRGIIEYVKEFNYLGFTLTDDGRDNKDILNKTNRGRQVIRALHPLAWDSGINKNTKVIMYKTIVESLFTYGAGLWTANARDRSRIQATEMEYWRRCCQVTRRERFQNQRIREIMKPDKSTLESIETKALLWYGHVRRLGEERLPKKVWQYIPEERGYRGRPRKKRKK